MTQLWYHLCQTHKSYAHKNRACFELLKLLDMANLHPFFLLFPSQKRGFVWRKSHPNNLNVKFYWENGHRWEGTVRSEVVYSFINWCFWMSGSTGGAWSYQSVKEMTGMYALLICPLSQFSLQWTEFWLLPKTVFETLELEELHSEVSIC